MIDSATVQKIKDTADIVDVVGDYVHLVRRGANYMGLCPFHNERTPSFSVNKSRNFCYCFSCHKGGSPVNFLMEKEGISYYDALKLLAKKYGIKIEERELTDREKEIQGKKEGMYLANNWTMQYFESNLRNSEAGKDIALSYLYHRGVTEEAIKHFHLGYAIDQSNDFLNAALLKGFSSDTLQELGLIGKGQFGLYDRFRGRIIFPFINSSGKVIAFGGRDMKGGPAKYINSPESDIYKKSNELYGIFQARQEIVREKGCFLVEGYLDVIGMWQAGFKNVVASSGTALTDGQIALIKRLTDNVTLIYDGDNAGIHAALRGIDMLLMHDLNVKVLLLPDGEDPDSFARKNSTQEFRNYIEQHQTDMVRFKAEVLMKEADKDPQKRVEAIQSVVASLACIADEIKRVVYIQECSRIMGIPENSIIFEVSQKLKKNNREKTRFDSKNQSVQKPANSFNNNLRPLELEVIIYALKYGFLTLNQIDNEKHDNNTAEDTGGETVVECIREELDIDGVNFSTPEFAHIFRSVVEMLPAFKKDLENFKSCLQQERLSRLKNGYDTIAGQQLSVTEISKKEKELIDAVDKWQDEEIYEYSKKYSLSMFSNHENPDVRKIVSEAAKQRHKLSKFYLRENPNALRDDRLLLKILTSISVLKNGILENKFNELISRFKEIVETGNVKEIQIMQAQLAGLIKQRSEVARNIGDRIISPNSFSHSMK